MGAVDQGANRLNADVERHDVHRGDDPGLSSPLETLSRDWVGSLPAKSPDEDDRSGRVEYGVECESRQRKAAGRHTDEQGNRPDDAVPADGEVGDPKRRDQKRTTLAVEVNGIGVH